MMNQTALITGASKRIGKALTEHLAERGWNIIIHYNSSAHGAQKLSDALKSSYPEQEFPLLKANLSNTVEVESLIPEALNCIASIDLLINNASVFGKGYISQTSSELYDLQMQVNLKAPFILIKNFKTYCENGNIVNFVDTRISTNKTDYSAYSLSKKGLWDLTKMAALELAPTIRVNAIAPGVTLAPKDKDENYLLALAKNIPMQKPGGVQPILKSLDYILENDHLTGQLLFADGGENLGLLQS